MKNIALLLYLLPSIIYCNVQSDSLLSIWQESSNDVIKRAEALDLYLDREITLMKNKEITTLIDSFELIAKKHLNQKYLSRAFYHKGNLFYIKNDFLTSSEYYLKMLAICKYNNDTLGIVKAFTGIGRNYNFLGNFQQANKYYFAALKNINSYNDTIAKNNTLLTIYNNIGSIYFHLGQYEKSMYYFRLAQKFNKIQGYEDGIFGYYVNISACYLKLDDNKNALIYLDSSIVISNKEGINPVFKANALSNKGALLIKLGDTLEGIRLTEKAIEIFKSIGSEYNHALSLGQIAHAKSGQESINTALLALKIATEIKAENLQLEIYNLLYKKYKSIGEEKLALSMLEEKTALEEQINSTNSLLQLSEFEKQKQIDSLTVANKERLNDIYKNYSSKTFFIICGATIFAIIILLLFVIWFLKQKAEKKKLLSEITLIKESQINYQTKELVNNGLPISEKSVVEQNIDGKLNETDWNIITTICAKPIMSNKEIATKVNMSVDGVKSSLKKMYRIFDIPTSQNMKLALVHKIMVLSKNKP